MTDLSHYDFELPDWAIATHPVEPRDHCKLMVYNKKTKTIEDRRFKDLPDFLSEGDILVLNDTKVEKRRFFGRKESGAHLEILLLERDSQYPYRWKALVSNYNKLKVNSIIHINGLKDAKVFALCGDGFIILDFSEEINLGLMEDHGEIPLPPYILKLRAKEKTDELNYQTVFANKSGSIASPTAGLHFTNTLLATLEAKGVEIIYITLHVSVGTFKPIQGNDIREHAMDEEYYEIGEKALKTLQHAIDHKKRIITVGTTTTRVLESRNDFNYQGVMASRTGIYIYPGYRFKHIQGLITNFHTPKSTPLLLAAAWMGWDELKTSYKHALENNYRFYSFGDAMFIF